MNYIDVSQWQDVIDWEKAKTHIDGAILRAGYGQNHIDGQFERNASECNRLGIPCGAYWFSYARNADMARQEAEYLLTAVKPYRMELPLAFDFEYDSVEAAKKNGVIITKDLATEMVRAFCETIEQGGYWALFYANPDYLSRYFDANLPDRFGLWLAEWGRSSPSRSCAIWQHSSKGVVPGIRGDVDMDKTVTDFKSVIAGAGLNHLNGDPAEELARRIGLNLDAPDQPITRIELARALLKFKEEIT